MKAFPAFIGISLVVLTACFHTAPRPTLYVLDDGTIGWVKITYNQPDAPALPVENNFVVAHIPKDRKLATRSRMNPAWEGSTFYYQTADGKRVSLPTQGDKQQRVWGKEKTSDRSGDREDFFIGNEEQMANQTKEMNFVGGGMDDPAPPEPAK